MSQRLSSSRKYRLAKPLFTVMVALFAMPALLEASPRRVKPRDVRRNVVRSTETQNLVVWRDGLPVPGQMRKQITQIEKWTSPTGVQYEHKVHTIDGRNSGHETTETVQTLGHYRRRSEDVHSEPWADNKSPKSKGRATISINEQSRNAKHRTLEQFDITARGDWVLRTSHVYENERGANPMFGTERHQKTDHRTGFVHEDTHWFANGVPFQATRIIDKNGNVVRAYRMSGRKGQLGYVDSRTSTHNEFTRKTGLAYLIQMVESDMGTDSRIAFQYLTKHYPAGAVPTAKRVLNELDVDDREIYMAIENVIHLGAHGRQLVPRLKCSSSDLI
jgi:hypothetical protein